MKIFPNKKEAWKNALRILCSWREKHQVILQDLGDRIEASMYLTMDDYDDEEDMMALVDRVRKSMYCKSLGRDVFGEYALFKFPYKE